MCRRLLQGLFAYAVFAGCVGSTNEVVSRPSAPAPIPPPRTISGPSVDVIGTDAAAIWTALEAALVEQHLALGGTAGVYEIPSLVCQHVFPPPPALERHQCQLDYRVGATGPVTSVKIGSPTAQSLFEAFDAAGGDPFLNKYSSDLRLANVKVARTGTTFEDRSKIRPPIDPNVQVTGALATAVLDALIAAGVHNDDGTLLIVCGATTGPLTCSYWSYPNGFGTPSAATNVDATTSQALWSSIKKAGEVAGIKPDGDTNAPPTLFNARSFTWDGTTLRLHLTLSDVKLPPTPPPSP